MSLLVPSLARPAFCIEWGHNTHSPWSSKLKDARGHLSLILTLCLPGREVGRDSNANSTLWKKKQGPKWRHVLAVARISSGGLAEPRDSWHLLCDISNFWRHPMEKASSLTGAFTAFSVLHLPTLHRKYVEHEGPGTTSTNVLCSWQAVSGHEAVQRALLTKGAEATAAQRTLYSWSLKPVVSQL